MNTAKNINEVINNNSHIKYLNKQALTLLRQIVSLNNEAKALEISSANDKENGDFSESNKKWYRAEARRDMANKFRLQRRRLLEARKENIAKIKWQMGV
jgi:hypothetical protein